ncbi:hypothetical protein GCM10028807_26370 [Spirosoma daeguense]
MNINETKDYNPADDDNQGVVQLLAQAEKAEPGVAQAEQMSPSAAANTNSSKTAEMSDNERINDDVLAEEETELGEQTMNNK